MREQTHRWLSDHQVPCRRFVMRRAGNVSLGNDLKRSWLPDGPIPKERVLLVFDDCDKLVAMWRREGLTCVQVHAGGARDF
jgi:hypothetical protein